jgi:hypothetical protein
VLTVGDEVRVKVIEVDVPRRRISLSMRQVGGALPRPATEIEEEAAPAELPVPIAPAAPAGESSTEALEVVAVEGVDEPLPASAAAPSPEPQPAAAESVAADTEPGVVAAGVAVSRGADGEADGGSPTAEVPVSTDDAVGDSPGGSPPATDESATTEAETPEEATEEDVSLEAILEDLKRREGRSE